MVKTIGNPLSWTAQVLGSGSHHIAAGAEEASGKDRDPVDIRKIGLEDLKISLRRGVDDFAAFRSDVIFICVVYPITGLLLMWFAFDRNLLPLLLPLISGFALIGPVAAVGLYEMSRRRERGETPGWGSMFKVIESPSAMPIMILGVGLLGLFLVWMLTAWIIYAATLGPEPPASIGAFIADIFGTAAGWTMLIVGTGIGFLFAVAVLSMSVISFPLLLDRHVGVRAALKASLRLSRENPVTVAIWGLIVAASLIASALTLFVGLIFALPILGHATWHLYRRATLAKE